MRADLLFCGFPAVAVAAPDGGSLVGMDRRDAADGGDAETSSAVDAGVAVDAAHAEPASPPDEPTETAETADLLRIDTALPPATPEPDIAPIVIGPEAVREPSLPIASADRPAVVIKTILGLLALLILAYVGGHPRVQALERKLGVSQVITAGFPFVMLGLVLRSRAVGLLNDTLLAELSPLLRVGLGCIGFVCGFRFGTQLRQSIGPDIVRVATLGTTVPFTVVAVVTGAVLLALGNGFHSSALRDPVFLRDALILGTAGAMTARTTTEVFRADDADRFLARILRLEELAGIVGLMVSPRTFDLWSMSRGAFRARPGCS